MDTAVVLTFPGHFFLTAMSIQSVRYFYPELKNIYVLYDDRVIDGWPDYAKDCCRLYQISEDRLIGYSQADPDIAFCGIGWYRQQLIKCSIDMAVPGDTWFVVDGDILFDESIDLVDVTPIQHRNDPDDPLSMAVLRCVKTLLSIDQHPLLADGQFKITSSIPFRILEKSVLVELRKRVSANIGGNFSRRIAEMVQNQELLAHDGTGNGMVLNEWELIEAVNHIMYPNRFCIKDIGSGYDLLKNTSACAPARFRHGYAYDYQLNRDWLVQQIDNDVVEQYWDKAVEYGKYFERELARSL